MVCSVAASGGSGAWGEFGRGETEDWLGQHSLRGAKIPPTLHAIPLGPMGPLPLLSMALDGGEWAVLSLEALPDRAVPAVAGSIRKAFS